MFIQILLAFCMAVCLAALAPGVMSTNLFGESREYNFLVDCSANIMITATFCLAYFFLNEEQLNSIIFPVFFTMFATSISDFQESL